MNYGIPYMGSKSRIAEKILDALPPAHTFYDLFAGGCAITHCALLSGKYEQVVCNDINPLPTRLFVDAVNGKYNNCKRWVSREEFHSLKDTDGFVKYCWSFGNNGKDYLYGRRIEPLKKLMHEMFFADTPKERRLIWKKIIRKIIDEKPGRRELEEIENIERLETLERLEALQSMINLERIKKLEWSCGFPDMEILNMGYSEIPISADSVIYCDIPYRGSKDYGQRFDYNRFYDWAYSQSVPVYISEYSMPEDRFECVLEINSTQKQGKTRDCHVTEKLFVPRKCGGVVDV